MPLVGIDIQPAWQSLGSDPDAASAVICGAMAHALLLLASAASAEDLVHWLERQSSVLSGLPLLATAGLAPRCVRPSLPATRGSRNCPPSPPAATSWPPPGCSPVRWLR
ncbi:hypothetical protein SYNGFB01_01485 [Synechococcus sp. GFB01]|nr:hypothetical protein SYNGFB01_01485 [Synechococcus sp. GFB01]